MCNPGTHTRKLPCRSGPLVQACCAAQGNKPAPLILPNTANPNRQTSLYLSERSRYGSGARRLRSARWACHRIGCPGSWAGSPSRPLRSSHRAGLSQMGPHHTPDRSQHQGRRPALQGCRTPQGIHSPVQQQATRGGTAMSSSMLLRYSRPWTGPPTEAWGKLQPAAAPCNSQHCRLRLRYRCTRLDRRAAAGTLCHCPWRCAMQGSAPATAARAATRCPLPRRSTAHTAPLLGRAG